jgi:hypothetical protein
VSSVDWFEWHKVYDDPDSPFAARLGVIQRHLAAVLDQMPPGPVTVVSMCAGQGRDILGALRDHPRRDEVVVTLIEQDRRNAEFAREAARAADLTDVTVVVADAGDSASYVGIARASLVIMVGFITHISDDDLARLVAFLPQLLALHGVALWCQGSQHVDRRAQMRALFARAGFVPFTVECAGDRRWTVGLERFEGRPRTLDREVQLFTVRPATIPPGSRLRRQVAKFRARLGRWVAAIRR